MAVRKVILISGGTSGIGLACAKVLLAQGNAVAINGRHTERGQRALQHLQGGDNACFIAGDVSTVEGCRQIVEQTIAQFGRLDGLVTSAGYYEEKLIDEVSLQEVTEMFTVNVYGTMFLCQAALPEIRKQKGAIVTIASDTALQGNIACSVYSATKGAVVAFTKSLALEEAPHQVRVNSICPGDVKTPLLDKQLAENPALSEESIKEQYPLYRIARAEEIAAVAAFLLSDGASYITAAAIPVDGGLTSW